MDVGLKVSAHNAIGFLEDENDATLNAKQKFISLEQNYDRLLRSRITYWIDLGYRAHKPDWFHGWPDLPKYKECFVFEWDEKRVHQRLYGFLCHPKLADRAFQLCGLVFHDEKMRADTDFTLLDRINDLRLSESVWKEIRKGLSTIGVRDYGKP